MADYASDQDVALLDQHSETTHRKVVSPPPRDVFAALLLCFAPLSVGFILGFSSPTEDRLQEAGLLSGPDQLGWDGSLAALGAMFGGPLAGVCLTRVGRKLSVVITALPGIVGWMMIAAAPSVGWLLAGRALTGISMGMTCVCLPLYIAEIAAPSRRGALGSLFQLSVVTGILLVFVLGSVLSVSWLAFAGLLDLFLLVLVVLPLPESPAWLVSRQHSSMAIASLRWLRGDAAAATAECYEIESAAESMPTLSPVEFLKPRLYLPLSVSLYLMLFQQFSGINAVIFNAEEIFKTAAPSISASLATVILGLVQVAATGIATALMDRAGRKPLLVISGSGLAISSFALGAYYRLARPDLALLGLLSLLLYITTFSLGWGAIPWLLMSEIFPAHARSAASSVATLFNWTCAFVVTREFVDFEIHLTIYGTFFMFGIINALGVLFTLAAVPETKGRSLEQVQAKIGGFGHPYIIRKLLRISQREENFS